MHGGTGAGRGPDSGDLEAPSGDLKIMFSSSEVHGDGVGGRRPSQAMHGGVVKGKSLDTTVKHGGRGGDWGSASGVLEQTSDMVAGVGIDGLLSHVEDGEDDKSKAVDLGHLDENMVDVNAALGRSMIQDGGSILGAYNGSSSNMAVNNGYRTQAMVHGSQGLNGGMSAEVCMGSGSMHSFGILPSASHIPCTSGVRCYASPDLEQKFPVVNSSGAASSPRHSHTMAWNRPKVVPMPPTKDLGKISLDGTTALLDDGEIDVALKRLEGALVGRLFGRKISYYQLSSELKRRWASYGKFRLITLRNDCFLCLFDCVAARDAVLMEGPWVLFGQVLGLDKWTSAFSSSALDGFMTPVWVRMPGLPFFCWTATNIARIVALIGEPLWIDSATEQMERGLFARACVRLDLSKPLKAGVWIEGKLGKFFQPFEYEGLSMFCFRCSQVGHKANNCKLAATKMMNVPSSNAPLKKAALAQPSTLDSCETGLHGDADSSSVATSDVSPQSLEDRGAGPWMLVVRKQRPNRGKSKVELRNPILHATAVDRLGHQQVRRAPGGAHSVAFPPGSCSSLDLRNSNIGAASSQLAMTRPLLQMRSSEWIPKQTRGAPTSAQAVSLPPQTSLSPSPPSLQPPLKEGDVLPSLAAGSDVLRSDAQALLGGSCGMAVDQSKVSLHVQNHVSSSAQQDMEEHLVFGGFKAMPVCSEGLHAKSGAAKQGARQRRGTRLGGKAAAIPLTLPSSCALTTPSLCVDADFSPVQGLDGSSSSAGAIVPYNKQEAIARMALEGGKRKGVLSLKVDKMLNDLGPIAVTPRKRRMIALNNDGGDASPLPTA